MSSSQTLNIGVSNKVTFTNHLCLILCSILPVFAKRRIGATIFKAHSVTTPTQPHQHSRDDIVANANLPMPLWELVGLVGALMALNAFAIDIMLPALDDIAASYQIARANDQQLILFAYVLGFGAPQLIFGPVSDARGRKGLLQICLLGYVVMSFLCMATTTFGLLLFVRFLQGIFASGVRVIAVSIVRDLVAGRAMAKIMSLVMTIFMIIPIIAPAIGQGIILFSSWEWTFGVLGLAGFIMMVWVQIRLPETLPVGKRDPLNIRRFFGAFWSVLSTRVSAGYMIASGVIFGALYAFIAAAEQIFSDVFNQGEMFPVWFAIISIALAGGSFMNAGLVERYGMRRMSHTITILFIILTLINFLVMKYVDESLIYFLPLFALSFGCFGMLGANYTAIAMEPQGKIAGTASAVYGFFTTTVASIFGWLVADRFDGNVAPVVFGFFLLGIGSLIIVLITERGKLFELGR